MGGIEQSSLNTIPSSNEPNNFISADVNSFAYVIQTKIANGLIKSNMIYTYSVADL